MSNDREAIIRLHRRWIDELWHADLDRIADLAGEIFAPDFVGRWPEAAVHGPDALAEWLRAGLMAFTEPRMTVDLGPLVDGDLAAARWTFRGRYAGGIPGATAPVGTAVAFSGMEFLRYDAGRFVEYWVSSNEVDSHRQLGFAVAGCFETEPATD
ncbi:ester cyclase [Streptoalloteichus hindustanus]|uniref:Predicted ester cyclase n=1 Tax=Streptoalloteichus hindustanus TaxID=2017 RepID=A0A1M5LXK9_STRHI|nr:nuclear transport factor 2 family protein [Streptoalloteichus hindustanus]SHG69834.1 Predicted ester cyclase [Streptoalloteichus hindustanus]